MPDPDLAMILSFVTAIIVVITIGKVVTKAMERRGKNSPRELSELSERMARIEAAVDSIAIEMERVSEGQRFTTKLLTDRAREPQGSPIDR